MGRIELELLLHEHAYRPITGEVLAIGRQHIGPKPAAILSMLGARGILPRSDAFEIDQLNTHHAAGEQSVLDTSFFRSFTDAKYFVADISPYEGADFIFDICGEVPPELVGRFDFIIDGGSLDNVFDPPAMVRNMTRMLKPGGRMFIYAWSSGFASAYVKISPDWIMDYCAVNEFADAKVYASRHDAPFDERTLGSCVDLHHYDPLIETASGPAYEGALVRVLGHGSTYCIAEKGEASTTDRPAVQKHYRGKDVEPYLSAAKRFHDSPRPIFSLPGQPDVPEMPKISDQPTVRPVARFGAPRVLSLEELILHRLNSLAVDTALSRRDVTAGMGAISTSMMGFSSELQRTGKTVATQVYDTSQRLSRQLYEYENGTVVASDAVASAGAAPRRSLLRRAVGRLRRAFKG